MVNFGMFQDFRAIHGDAGLEAELRSHLTETAQRCNLFFPYMARHITRFPPPLGIFGQIRVERRGEHRGEVDLKKAGIFAITEGMSLLALESGVTGGSTWDKIELLANRKVLSTEDIAILDESFTYLVGLRLQRQLKALAAGGKSSNHINPLVMTDLERDQLRHALKGVSTLLRILRSRYNLDAISR
jgi:CBS domain-containing protein